MKDKRLLELAGITEASSNVPDDVMDFFRRIKSAHNWDMTDVDSGRSVSEWNGTWSCGFRDSEFFTASRWEEDDDHPAFTGKDKFDKIFKSAFRDRFRLSYTASYSDSEKNWIEVTVTPKK